MKTFITFLIIGHLFYFQSYAQKDKIALKAEKSVNKDAAKSAREANKAFKDKNYYTAILEGVDALDGELNKKNTKNIAEILTESYSVLEKNSLYAIGLKEKSSLTYSGRNSVSDKSFIVEQYSRLIEVQEKLGTMDEGTLSSFGLNRSSFVDYSDNLESSNNKYLEYANLYCAEQYSKGESELSYGTKQSAFRAYFHFDEVTTFIPDYRDAAELRNNAKEMATYSILFVDFSTNYTPPPGARITSSIAEMMRGSLDKHKGSKYAPFVKFTVTGYTNDIFLNVNNNSAIEAFCQAKEIDAVIFGTYEVPTFTSTDGKPDSKEIEREITVGEKKEIQDGKEVMVPIKQKAKATRTHYSRMNISKVNGKYYLYDAYQQKYILKEFGMQGEYSDRQSWTIATGDLRVFDEKEQKNLRKDALPLPDKTELQHSAIVELAIKVENKSIEALKTIYEGN